MNWTPTEDDCREFAQKVRWLTGVDIPQFVAGRYLEELREKYASDAQRREWGAKQPEVKHIYTMRLSPEEARRWGVVGLCSGSAAVDPRAP